MGLGEFYTGLATMYMKFSFWRCRTHDPDDSNGPGASGFQIKRDEVATAIPKGEVIYLSIRARLNLQKSECNI